MTEVTQRTFMKIVDDLNYTADRLEALGMMIEQSMRSAECGNLISNGVELLIEQQCEQLRDISVQLIQDFRSALAEQLSAPGKVAEAEKRAEEAETEARLEGRMSAVLGDALRTALERTGLPERTAMLTLQDIRGAVIDGRPVLMDEIITRIETRRKAANAEAARPLFPKRTEAESASA